MDNKYFLNMFNSKKAVNTSEGLNISLMGKRRLLPTNDMSEVISQYDVYTDERRNCNTIRLTCQINSLCTNVLFNRITEIVKNEGSDKLTFINYGLSGNSTESDNVISNKIKYKKKQIYFWSGGTMNYQGEDNENSSEAPDTTQNVPKDLISLKGNKTLSSQIQFSHPTNSIRDTQMTNDNYIYHCGLDILNNHLIRSNTFKPICKCNQDFSGDGWEYDGFNTIGDILRDANGNKVVEIMPFPISAGVPNNAKFITMHVYEYDDILSFNDCIKNKLKIKHNGWAGFYNSSKIKSYEDSETILEIEKPIMYKNSGDYIDMYPDRSLFAFTPKYNKYRNRYENNWNYCLTYPSSSTTDGFEDIIETTDGINSLKAIYFDENNMADNGTKQLVVYSIAKHGLNVGDYVNIYITNEDENGKKTVKVLDNAEVTAIVDDFIFTVFNDTQISKIWVELTEEERHSSTLTVDGKEYTMDMDTRKFYYYGDNKDIKYYIVNDKYVNFDIDAHYMSYKKVVNDIESDYYVRIFSKLPNFKNASADTSNEYEIYKNDGEVIKTYQNKEYDFESHPSRLAFAKNIYSDDIGEIVFTDNINISNLKDNLGRPLSSIYLTLIKNNKGYKEWYGYGYPSNKWVETEALSNNVEFSHCFGAIRCGIATSEESSIDNTINSINKINLISSPYGYKISNINGKRSYYSENGIKLTIDNNEIWFDKDKNYYGDLCCYDNYNAIEQSIQPFFHRFNTAQRESVNSQSSKYYYSFVYDEINKDDYDSNDYEITTKIVIDCNSKKEGYYYQPHYEIPIKSYGKLITAMPDFLTMKSLTNTIKGTRISTMEKHYLAIGDKSMIYDMWNDKYYYCTTIVGDDDNDRVFTCKIYGEDGNEVYLNDLYTTDNIDYESYDAEIASKDILNFKLFKIDNLDIPSYAKILKDGTCRFIWRDIINNGMENSDKSIEEYPFTNGAFYINKKIDLYLRRQDPYDIYNLYSEDDILGNDVNYESEDNYVKEDDITC